MKPYRVPQLAKKYVEYDMIQTHTELPPFPDARVQLLYIFLDQGTSRPNAHSELFSLVTSLVQMGIDTHETIDTQKDKLGEGFMRSRQLKVLAGDYFSSRFYQLLSHKGQIEVVSRLSQAICDVNVLKMNLYGKMKSLLLSAEEYLRQTVQLNMQLFLSFTPLLEESLYDMWSALLRNVTECETVAREMQRSASETYLYSYSYWHILDIANEEDQQALKERKIDNKDWKKLMLKYKAGEQMADKLRQAVDSVQTILKNVKGDSRFREIGQILEPFQRQLHASGSAVGEG
ncbi:heptaprenyl diphosphate synthase component 1 [Paenibacillus sp.]|jgi:heptaprenyl diphosphate synthase|uniref:heptaprenyl diphosphate synthase component 1 n=1 Tax=Paenibacillus sp. TaxID=58172 RepID=UPI002821D011|nr:heptaprenyl diphosphate synthase component 1 [Paenibacillus sp.]MDR0270306.1 heptaprenyl diphosphate synthase component 1 [Paenibacillus sp.]